MSPQNDGIDHINIYSKGKTNLGKFLSNFTYCPITLEHGHFASIEAYWYWLLRDDPHNQLPSLYGFKAKQIGRTLQLNPKFAEDKFQELIKTAMWIKINSVPEQRTEFTNSILPFEHYYVYNNQPVKAGHSWIIKTWDLYRTHLKQNPLF